MNKITPQRRWALKNSEKTGAYVAIQRWVEMGLMQPAHAKLCFRCHGPAHDYHHYRGYDEQMWPFVVALCKLCHKWTHKNVEHDPDNPVYTLCAIAGKRLDFGRLDMLTIGSSPSEPGRLQSTLK